MSPHLATATRRRVQDTRARGRVAISQLDRDGAAINYVTVARAANVSRSMLYRDTALRREIDNLRASRLGETPPLPATQRMN